MSIVEAGFGCFVTGFIVGISVVGRVNGFFVMGEFVVDVDAVGFRVGNRVVSVDVVGFIVELEAVCLTVVDSGNTLGIKIHSGGNSVFSEQNEAKI